MCSSDLAIPYYMGSHFSSHSVLPVLWQIQDIVQALRQEPCFYCKDFLRRANKLGKEAVISEAGGIVMDKTAHTVAIDESASCKICSAMSSNMERSRRV